VAADQLTSVASRVILALSSLETGQPALALAASSSNLVWFAPGTLAFKVRRTGKAIALLGARQGIDGHQNPPFLTNVYMHLYGRIYSYVKAPDRNDVRSTGDPMKSRKLSCFLHPTTRAHRGHGIGRRPARAWLI